MSLMIQENAPPLEICPFRLQHFRKKKKDLWPQRLEKVMTSVEGHFANMTNSIFNKKKRKMQLNVLLKTTKRYYNVASNKL